MNYYVHKGLFYCYAFYPDIKNNKDYFISDSFRFPVKFKGDFAKDDKPYVIVNIKFKNKYYNDFIKVMDNAENRSMILNIYDVYKNAVTDFANILGEEN